MYVGIPVRQQIADCSGFNESIDQTQVRDLVIIGAGPSGLVAAVYGASEGFDVLMLETSSPGLARQVHSSKIENYLGFPTGISGQELASRVYHQAEKFGTEMLIANGTRLICDSKPYVVEVENGVPDSCTQCRDCNRGGVSRNRHGKTCRALKVWASITARPLWKRSCAVERK